MTNLINQINMFPYDAKEIWDLWTPSEANPAETICDIIFGEKVIQLTEPDVEL